jgi:hypothetical protein
MFEPEKLGATARFFESSEWVLQCLTICEARFGGFENRAPKLERGR